MTKQMFTGQIKSKGWSVTDALSRWGRTYDWYHRNCNGNDKAKTRLKDMIAGLEVMGNE